MKFSVSLTLLVALIIIPTSSALGQVIGPQVLLTWQAATYVPPNFNGKALPTSDSQITAGVDLIDQGQHVDLSSFKIYWYLNDAFFQGGAGLTRVSFTAPHFIGKTSVRLRVAVSNYGNGASRTIQIPVVPAQAVIESSSPSLSAATVPFTLQADPYFFNVQDPSLLQFNWTMNGSSVGTQNPFVITQAMAQSGNPVPLELQITNPARAIESARQDIILFPSS